MKLLSKHDSLYFKSIEYLATSLSNFSSQELEILPNTILDRLWTFLSERQLIQESYLQFFASHPVWKEKSNLSLECAQGLQNRWFEEPGAAQNLDEIVSQSSEEEEEEYEVAMDEEYEIEEVQSTAQELFEEDEDMYEISKHSAMDKFLNLEQFDNVQPSAAVIAPASPKTPVQSLLSRLTSLNISGTSIGFEGLVIIKQLCNTNLKELHLNACKRIKMKEPLNVFPEHLKVLGLHGTRNISTAVFQHLSSLKSLQYLNISEIAIESSEMIRSIASLTTLETLIAASCELEDSHVEMICSSTTHLQWLDISGNSKVTDQSLNPLSKLSQTLLHLYISGTTISLPSLLQFLSSNSKLETIGYYMASDELSIHVQIQEFLSKTNTTHPKPDIYYQSSRADRCVACLKRLVNIHASSLSGYSTYGSTHSLLAPLQELTIMLHGRQQLSSELLESTIGVLSDLLKKYFWSNDIRVRISMIMCTLALYNAKDLEPILLKSSLIDGLLHIFRYIIAAGEEQRTRYARLAMYASLALWNMSSISEIKAYVHANKGMRLLHETISIYKSNATICEYLFTCMANISWPLVVLDGVDTVALVKLVLVIMNEFNDTPNLVDAALSLLRNLTCDVESTSHLVASEGMPIIADLLDLYAANDGEDEDNILPSLCSLLWNISEIDSVRHIIFTHCFDQLRQAATTYWSDFNIQYCLAMTLCNLGLNSKIQLLHPESAKEISSMVFSVAKRYDPLTSKITVEWGKLNPLFSLVLSKDEGIMTFGLWCICNLSTIPSYQDRIVQEKGIECLQKCCHSNLRMHNTLAINLFIQTVRHIALSAHAEELKKQEKERKLPVANFLKQLQVSVYLGLPKDLKEKIEETMHLMKPS